MVEALVWWQKTRPTADEKNQSALVRKKLSWADPISFHCRAANLIFAKVLGLASRPDALTSAMLELSFNICWIFWSFNHDSFFCNAFVSDVYFQKEGLTRPCHSYLNCARCYEPFFIGISDSRKFWQSEIPTKFWKAPKAVSCTCMLVFSFYHHF